MLKSLRFFIIVFVLVLLFLPGFAKFQELRQRLTETQDLIQKTQKENYLLEQRIAQLKNDPHYLEIVAREKMGVVKKGETVLRIVHEGEEGNVTIPSFNQTGNQTKSSL
jgi:cell division protein FtsB